MTNVDLSPNMGFASYDSSSDRNKNEQNILPSNRYLGYNRTTKHFELYDGSKYVSVNGVSTFDQTSDLLAQLTDVPDGHTVYNKELESLMVFDSTTQSWKAKDIDLESRGLVPDWFWDFRRLNYADGVEISSFEGGGLKSNATLTQVSTAFRCDRDGVWGGRSAYVDAGMMACTDLGHNVRELTVNAFIQVSSSGFAFVSPISHYDTSLQKQWLILMTSNRGFRFYISGDGTNTDFEYRTTDNVISPDTLTHVGFVWDNGTLKCFVDGSSQVVSKISDSTTVTTLHATTNLNVGIAGRYDNSTASSKMAETNYLLASIFDRALTSNEMKQYYYAVKSMAK